MILEEKYFPVLAHFDTRDVYLGFASVGVDTVGGGKMDIDEGGGVAIVDVGAKNLVIVYDHTHVLEILDENILLLVVEVGVGKCLRVVFLLCGMIEFVDHLVGSVAATRCQR